MCQLWIIIWCGVLVTELVMKGPQLRKKDPSSRLRELPTLGPAPPCRACWHTAFCLGNLVLPPPLPTSQHPLITPTMHAHTHSQHCRKIVMVKKGFPQLPSAKDQGWGDRVPYADWMDTYSSPPLHSLGLETASHLTVAGSFVQPVPRAAAVTGNSGLCSH